MTLRLIADKYARGIPLTMVTAYDYPSAVHVDEAGIDLLLIGVMRCGGVGGWGIYFRAPGSE